MQQTLLYTQRFIEITLFYIHKQIIIKFCPVLVDIINTPAEYVFDYYWHTKISSLNIQESLAFQKIKMIAISKKQQYCSPSRAECTDNWHAALASTTSWSQLTGAVHEGKKTDKLTESRMLMQRTTLSLFMGSGYIWA